MALSSDTPGALPAPPRPRWHFREIDNKAVDLLSAEAGVPPLIARILCARGIVDPESALEFLEPPLKRLGDPFALKGMEPAVERIIRAIDGGETIWIYGDYDVDGVSATAIMLQTIIELGGQADYYIPHRLNEGYGLNAEAIEELAGQGARLIVTVDCGITSVAEAQVARERGVDLIVTDHHEPGPELPDALAVINPKQPGCTYPSPDLAGAGVAFKLAHALLKRRHPDPERGKAFLKSLLDLVALGTVADIVPLVGENRSLVAHGLDCLRRARRTGVKCLCERAGLKIAQLSSGSISFGLAPRLNAAGRTEHAMFGAELLNCTDPHEARSLAERLETFNDQRRAIEQQTLEEAMAELAARAADDVIVLAGEGWHPGVIGIVASRILGLVYRPTIIVALDGDRGKGSGRSVKGFDLHGALTACGEHLIQFGGHKMAAGMRIETDRLEAFRAAIISHAREVLRDEDRRPLLSIDAVAQPGDLDLENVRWLDRLAPHGMGNPKPLIVLENYQLVEDPYPLKHRHLKMHVATRGGHSMTVVGWNMAHRLDELDGYRGPIRLAGTPIINTWGGRSRVELELKDFQLA